MNRHTFEHRGSFRVLQWLFGIVWVGSMGTLLGTIILALISGRAREPIEYIFAFAVIFVGSALLMLGIAFSLLRRKCTIDCDANSVEAGWYVIRPLHVRRESLSAFGAVTITPGGSGRPGIDRRGRVFLNVCLIRGNREEAATIACSAMDIFSRGGVYVLRDDREVRAASSDVSVAVWRDAVERLCIVTAIPENVEVARRTAADVAKLTDLPFGHPTLGPDATDPAMLPLDLPRDLCLSCRERNK